MTLASSLLALVGAILVLVACIGLLRLPDLYTRMHASTKPATLGILFLVVALAVRSADVAIAARALLILLFFLLTAPVAAHRLGQAAHRAGVPRWSGTVRDDLAEARGESAGSGGEGS